METFKENLERSEKYKGDLTAMITSLLEKDPEFAQKISEAVNKAKPSSSSPVLARGGRKKASGNKTAYNES
jgi:hypothetical protein